MARIEVKDTGEFDTVNDEGDVFRLVESSTIYVEACENSPIQSRVASKSYKLTNGMYVTKTDADHFEIARTGMRLKKISTPLAR